MSAVPAVDLLVVGGGPVGVATALLARQRGLSVRLLERALEIYDLPRAVGMDDEIQRVFQNAGLADALREVTTVGRGAEFVSPEGERLTGIEWPHPDDMPDFEWPLGYAPLAFYDQPELEQLLRDAATDAGVELVLGAEAVELEQDDDTVRVDSIVAGNRRRDTGRWLVAADGAASPTRKALGIAFEDAGFDQDWLVVDVRLHSDIELPHLAQQICDPRRPVTFIPGHGSCKRWEFQLQPGEVAEAMTEPATVWELVSPWLGPDDAELRRAVVYRFHATVAAAMRSGRVFLAGDAAHQMPPFLGQGLCSGLRDAANLSWKLAMVAEGRAGDRLLDSYDIERRPHAHAMVEYAVDCGRAIDRLSRRAPDDPVDTEAAYGGGRAYPHLVDGVLAGEHLMRGRQAPQPRVDGRLLDEQLGTGWALLTSDADSLPPGVGACWEAVGARIVGLGAATPPWVPADGVVFVRPDRYAAAVANSPDEIEAYSDELLAWLRD